MVLGNSGQKVFKCLNLHTMQREIFQGANVSRSIMKHCETNFHIFISVPSSLVKLPPGQLA